MFAPGYFFTHYFYSWRGTNFLLIMAKLYDNDDFLLQRLKEDDEKALEFLFRSYYPALLSISARIVDNQEQARDIIQEVFATLWEKRHSLSISKPVRAYLFRAVINRSLNHIRDFPKSLTTSLSSLTEGQHSSSAREASGKMEEGELRSLIEASVQALPPQCKAVFQLSRNEEMSNREIADLMDISVKAVEKHISKALKKLRKSLSAYFKSLLLLSW